MKLVLPRETWSALGPIPVLPLSHDAPNYEHLFGRFLPDSRHIEIADGMTPPTQWSTFWHEATHIALMDAGANNVLTEIQIEVVCDALGAYLAGMTLAGVVKHSSTGRPRDAKS